MVAIQIRPQVQRVTEGHTGFSGTSISILIFIWQGSCKSIKGTSQSSPRTGNNTSEASALLLEGGTTMATAEKLDTTGWEVYDWIDLIPAPGSFCSKEPAKDYEVHGETVHALNWLHAEHLWLQRQIAENSEEWGRCCHCNHAIRYAVVFSDKEGRLHMVGQDCAEFISSRLPKDAWAEKRKLSEVKVVNTKNGERAVWSTETPSWFWSVPKEERPKFTSLQKREVPSGRRGMQTRWYLSIWGDTPGEVLRNWETVQDLKRVSGA